MPKDDIFRIVQINPDALRAECSRLLKLIRDSTPFGKLTEAGSTAVEGVIGKGDLDFALGVAAEEFESARIDLDRAFIRDAEQLSTKDYQGYRLPSEMKASLQLFVAGGHYDRFDRFVELLRNDPGLREAYNSLKCRWDGKSMDLYREAKSEFIERALSGATGDRPRPQEAH